MSNTRHPTRMAQSVLKDVSVGGAFVRPQSVFRNFVQRHELAAYPPAAGRYCLIVSYACPWASRCLIFRKVKGLEEAIPVYVVSPVWARTKPDVDDHEGWVFDPKYPGSTDVPECLKDASVRTIRDVYTVALSKVDGGSSLTTRYTVPILFDTQTLTIVNNESSEIIRMLKNEFNEFAKHPEATLIPEALQSSIDAMNERLYESICNGVYKCGFAQSQRAYEDAAVVLFERLDEIDALLAKQRYLVSHTQITESDVRLFVTLVRFDEVYVAHFKCDKKLIREYANLRCWLRDVYQTLDLASTVNMQHIKDHYYRSHTSINRYGIVPLGGNTILDLTLPHGRESLQEN